MPKKRRRSLRLREKRVAFSKIAIIALLVTIIVTAVVAVAANGKKYTSSLAEGNVVDVVDLDEVDYWSLVSQGRVLVFVEQVNCPGCKYLRPYVAQFASEHPDVLVVRLHIDKVVQNSPDKGIALLGSLRIQGTPTLILYVDGEEVARQLGVFPGDQLEGLEKFVFQGVTPKPEDYAAVREEQAEQVQESIAYALLASAGLGIAAAFSPCSVPLLAAYTAAQTTRGSASRAELLKSNVFLLGIVGFGGILLALVSFMVPTIAGVPLETVMLVYAGTLITVWGLYEAKGYTVGSRNLDRAARFLPLLGLQCSLPFLLTALAVASTSITTAAASALGFSAGFTLPYIAAGTGLRSVFRPLADLLARNKVVRSGILVAAGLFIVGYGLDLALAA